MQKLLTFFSAKHLSVYAIFNDQSFNGSLTNDIVSFEQLGPGLYFIAIFAKSYKFCGQEVAYRLSETFQNGIYS